jgi:uncharacterized caspase-like protein
VPYKALIFAIPRGLQSAGKSVFCFFRSLLKRRHILREGVGPSGTENLKKTLSVISSFALAAISFCTLAPAQERCGAGTDLMVQALERVQPNSSPAQIRDAVELLKHATAECISLGDAWYYRSLLERKLGNARLADYSLEKARQNNSEALQQQLDPFVLSTNPNVRPAGQVREKYALVVGIGKFVDKSIPTLRYTTADANGFSQALLNANVGRFKSSNVAVLTDYQATTKNIREKLNWLARVAQPDDLVVIYFATHGSSRDLDTAGVNYIITADTEITPKKGAARESTSDRDQDIDHDALFATALPMVEVANTVASRVKAQRVAVFLDTCFSGAAAGSGGTKNVSAAMGFKSVSTATLDRMSEGAGRVILAASQENQESLESASLGHGYFTYYILQGLQASKGMDTMGKLYLFVRNQVSTLAKQAQVPVMAQSDQGDEIVRGVPMGSGAGTHGGP